MTLRFELELTPEEREALNAFAASASQTRARRARIVLMSAQRVPQVAIASQTGLSERQVRRWQRAFQRRRMAIFEPAPGRASRTPRKPRARRSNPPRSRLRPYRVPASTPRVRP
jgi:hypothetical protein